MQHVHKESEVKHSSETTLKFAIINKPKIIKIYTRLGPHYAFYDYIIFKKNLVNMNSKYLLFVCCLESSLMDSDHIVVKYWPATGSTTKIIRECPQPTPNLANIRRKVKPAPVRIKNGRIIARK